MRRSRLLGADHTAAPNLAEQFAQTQTQVLQLKFNIEHVQIQFNARNASNTNPAQIAQNEAEMQVLQTKMNAPSAKHNLMHLKLNIYEAKTQPPWLTFQLHLRT
jgi:hypothetical protein